MALLLVCLCVCMSNGINCSGVYINFELSKAFMIIWLHARATMYSRDTLFAMNKKKEHVCTL